MKTLTSIEAKTRFGEISEIVAREPLAVRKHNRLAFIAVSGDDYRRLAEMEKRVRQDAFDALSKARDEVDAKGMSATDKAKLMADLGLTYHD